MSEIQFSKMIKQLRKYNNLSLQDVADKTRLSKAHLWEIESKRALNPSLSSITKLASFYKVSLDYIVYGNTKCSSGNYKQIVEKIRKLIGEKENE